MLFELVHVRSAIHSHRNCLGRLDYTFRNWPIFLVNNLLIKQGKYHNESFAKKKIFKIISFLVYVTTFLGHLVYNI